MVYTKFSLPEDPPAAVWLVDNGSLRAQSVLALRRQARAVSLAAAVRVEPVSVLHSAKIPPHELDGVAAEVFARALRQRAAAGLRRLRVVPYFFGTSAALTDYLPEQIDKIRQDFPDLYVEITPPLVDLDAAGDTAALCLAQLLARQVAATAAEASLPLGAEAVSPLAEGFNLTAGEAQPESISAIVLSKNMVSDAEAAKGNQDSDASGGCSSQLPEGGGKASLPQDCIAVVLVDHGSPQPAVSAVRDRVGRHLRDSLGGRVRAVGVASMEAREGAAFDHSRPLLAQLLDAPPFCEGNVVIAPLFLGPGRHAGTDGDLARIALAAQRAHPRLKVVFCPLLGGTPEVTAILAGRVHGERLLWRSHP